MKSNILQIRDVEKLDLFTLSTLITEVYTKDKTLVNGAVFAHFAKELLAAEIKPGGPYTSKNSHTTMPKLNAVIGRLFIRMGHPLPNVDSYLETLDDSLLSQDDLHALKQYKAARDTILPKDRSPLPSTPYDLARATLEALEEPVRTPALDFLRRVELADTTKEIALLTHFSVQALTIDMPKNTLDLLGEANIHGWIAYMIYDHIIDNETSTTMLPVANICMRLSLNRYSRILPENHPLRDLVARYFDQVDVASAWELAYCRFKVSDNTIHVGSLPDYKEYEQLAKRTMIHIIGPIIAASVTSPLANNPKKINRLVYGLEQYLIARQLSDDIHDWRDDLKAGRISAVTAYLLRACDIAPDTSYELTTLASTLQRDFLQRISGDISTLIILHSQNARKALLEAGCNPSSELLGLITRLENMATASIQQQSHFLEFQSEYQQ
ncbi:MAG TPA: hypothetical protein VLG09_03055 [Candidatus Saccharimonadales bacterium]|nr:hypothetical protein [Candidatus Saccharimonadales bacterium]